MIQRQITITNETGLHARPASEFVAKASSYDCDVYLQSNDTKISAKSILGVLSLGLDKGKQAMLITEGPDEEQVADELSKFLSELKD